MSYWDLTDTDAARVGRWASLGSNNGNDSFGSNNGTWFGTPAYTSPPHGEGQAFRLNSTQRLDLASNVPVSNPSTFSVWVKGSTTSREQGLACKRSNSIDQLRFNGGAATLRLDLPIGTRTAYFTMSQPVLDGTWRHFTMVSRASGTTLYRDGISVGSSAVAWLSTFQEINTLFTSYFEADNAGRFNGDLYDARFYNRDITAAEVLELARGPEPKVTTNPVATASDATISSTTGVWSGYSNGAITYTRQWQRNIAGTWTDVAGRTLADHTATVSGDYRCRVTATNNGGSHLPAYTNTSTVTAGSSRTNVLRNRLANYLANH